MDKLSNTIKTAKPATENVIPPRQIRALLMIASAWCIVVSVTVSMCGLSMHLNMLRVTAHFSGFLCFKCFL